MHRPVLARSFNLIDDVLSPQTCHRLLWMFSDLPAGVWTHRVTMDPRRAVDNDQCDYHFTSHTRLPDELVTELVRYAPFLEGYQLDQVCINRYQPGQYIGKHVDRGHPRNMVISLVDNRHQGCLVDGTLVPDQVGRAVLHPGMSLPHSVPPVKEERFVLIYLYDFVGGLQCIHMNSDLNASSL